ncbi:MAG: protease inhibitor I42 family protein [Candidatus Eremiobacteraeota bacterium]|nr:protease inhibitor I42 family protein [Candidatus Eremiobacteraeota bacterium]
MRRISTFITALLLSVAPAAAQTSPAIPCRPIVTHVGSTFTITLPANGTTGYSWALEDSLKPSVVALRAKRYAPVSRLIGAPGAEIWTFSGVGRGRALISFKYARPWEKNAPPAKEALYVVAVR